MQAFKTVETNARKIFYLAKMCFLKGLDAVKLFCEGPQDCSPNNTLFPFVSTKDSGNQLHSTIWDLLSNQLNCNFGCKTNKILAQKVMGFKSLPRQGLITLETLLFQSCIQNIDDCEVRIVWLYICFTC